MGLPNYTHTEVQRHKTAIRRQGLSVPVRLLLEHGLLDSSRSFLDYGCGRGHDLLLLGDLGINSDGWDPVHRPDGRCEPSEVVNFGYVINVIEDPVERADALLRAWHLAGSVLMVSAQTPYAAVGKDTEAFRP